MIYVADKGRMANNMFQYANVYAWAQEHGRDSMSMRFAYKYHDFAICHTPHHNFATYAVAKYAAKLGLLPTVSYDDREADPRPLEQAILSHRQVLVKGWWVRHPDLLMKHIADLRHLFAFDPVVTEPVERRLKDTDPDVRLGLHIRRGDYVNFMGGRYFFTDEQYLNAVKRFAGLWQQGAFGNDGGCRLQVFVCGNDPHLDEAFYRRGLREVDWHFPKGTGVEDLCLLSRCRYLMGAPSSYTLMATMYDDASRLCWLTGDAAFAPSSFIGFDSAQRRFDSLFV